MKKRVSCILFVAGMAAALAFAAENHLSRVPAWVAHLITSQFPDAEVIETDREGEPRDNRYEVDLKRKDGRKITVDLVEDSGITDIDEELNPEQIPPRVLRGLHKAFPKAEVRKAEKNTDIKVTYSIDIVSEGRKREVRISPQGRIVEVEKRD